MKEHLTNTKKMVRWLIYSSILLSILVFLALNSKVPPKIDSKGNSKLICDNFRLNLPIAEKDNFKNLYEVDYLNIFIVESKKSHFESKPVLLFEGDEISFPQLEERIDDLTQSRPESGSNAKIVNLFIDSNIKMSFVQSVKELLSEKSLLHIAYAYKYPINNYGFYNLNFLNCFLPPQADSSETFKIQPLDLKEELSYFTNIINLSSYNRENLRVNDTILSDSLSSIYIARSIVADSNYIVILNINKDQSFDEFFRMRFYSRKATNQIKDDYSLQRYSIEFNLLNEEQQLEIRSKHPSRILELYEN